MHVRTTAHIGSYCLSGKYIQADARQRNGARVGRINNGRVEAKVSIPLPGYLMELDSSYCSLIQQQRLRDLATAIFRANLKSEKTYLCF